MWFVDFFFQFCTFFGIDGKKFIAFIQTKEGIIISGILFILIFALLLFRKKIMRIFIKKNKFKIIYPVHEIRKYPKTNNRLLLTIDDALDSNLIGLAATVYLREGSGETWCYVVKVEKPTCEGKTQLKSMVLTEHTINFHLNKQTWNNTIVKLGVDFDYVERWYDKYCNEKMNNKYHGPKAIVEINKSST